MQPPLPEYERNKIIELYLDGISPQSEIALRVGRSVGVVSNVINSFIRQLGQRDVKAMRTMAVAMQKTAIMPEQCVQGYRILRTLSAMGVPTDESGSITIASLESFINNIFQGAKNAGLAEDKVIEYAKLLFEISVNETIEPAGVPEYIEKKLKLKKEIDKEFEGIVERIDAIKDEEKKSLQEAKITEADLKEHIFVRDELKKYDRQIQDIPKLVNMLNNGEQLGYNATKMAAKLSEEESIEQKIQKDIGVFNQLENDIAAHAKSLQSLKEQVEANQDTVNEVDQLKKIGCGISELRILRNTITGIVNAAATGKERTSGQKAFKRFMQDVKRNYHRVAGFGYLEQEFKKLSKQFARLKVDVPLLEQRKMEAESYVNNALEELTKNIDGFIASLGTAQGKIDKISEEVGKAGRGSIYDFQNLVLLKQAGRFEQVINAYYKRRSVSVEDLVDPLHMTLDVMIRKLRTYAANEVYVEQDDVDRLQQVLQNAKDELEEFERKLGLSFDDGLQHKDSEAG